MTRRLALAHPLGAGKSNLAIQVHGENPRTLTVARKGKSGRLLRRPQQDYPAATVVEYCSAVLTFIAADLLPEIEAVMVRKLNEQIGDGHG